MPEVQPVDQPDDQTHAGSTQSRSGVPILGRIKALRPTVLQDNKTYYPLYNGVPVVLKKTNDAHPQILQVLKPLAAVLTTDTMAELNTEVSAKGEDPSKVAENFLKKKGFLK